jgi:hypothetical protein
MLTVDHRVRVSELRTLPGDQLHRLVVVVDIRLDIGEDLADQRSYHSP